MRKPFFLAVLCLFVMMSFTGVHAMGVKITQTNTTLRPGAVDLPAIRYHVETVPGYGGLAYEVYSVLIAARTPVGAPLPYSSLLNNPSSWQGQTAYISTSPGADRTVSAFLGGFKVFDNLPAEFSDYTGAYLFYAAVKPGGAYDFLGVDGVGLAGDFYVIGSNGPAPFIFSDSAINLEIGPNSYDGSGQTEVVPIPAAVFLLGPGLLGIAAARRAMRRGFRAPPEA